METSKLSCIGSPHHAFCRPTRGIGRGGSRGIKSPQAVKSLCSPQSSLSCGRPSPLLSLLPVEGVLSNLASGLFVWAVEEASLSTEAAASTQVLESAGAAGEGAQVAASQAVQFSTDGTSAAASSTMESVKTAASQAVQSSVERVGDATSQTVGVAGNSDMVVNILGTAAFVGLSLLTVGIVYLFITDFLEKRKRDEEMKKLNEEEAAARKGGGSLTAASKGGAKGFGRKRPVNDAE